MDVSSTNGSAAVVEVSSHASSVMDVSDEMVVLTWITFVLAALILYRLAWKPILAALDKRETEIRESLEEAEQRHQESEKAAQETKTMLARAQDDARQVVEQARKAAQDLAATLREKADKEARETVKSAAQEIDFARTKAVAALRKESAALAIDLAGKVVSKEMTAAEKSALMDRLLKEM